MFVLYMNFSLSLCIYIANCRLPSVCCISSELGCGEASRSPCARDCLQISPGASAGRGQPETSAADGVSRRETAEDMGGSEFVPEYIRRACAKDD